MPSADCELPSPRACACLTCPISLLPFLSTTWPSCFTSCVVFATTRSPGLLCFASTELTSTALMVLPLARSSEAGPELAEAEVEFAAEPEAELDPCAPFLLDCACCEAAAEVPDCACAFVLPADADACAFEDPLVCELAELCAPAPHAASVTATSSENLLMVNPPGWW